MQHGACCVCKRAFGVFWWRRQCALCHAGVCAECLQPAQRAGGGPLVRVCRLCARYATAVTPEAQLVAAVELNDVGRAQALIKAGASPNAKLRDARRGVHTPLKAALVARNAAMVELLLAARANPNQRCTAQHDLVPPLCVAIAAGAGPQILELLLAYGARLAHKCRGTGLTALHVALRARDAAAVRLLLRQGASPDLPDRAGETCAMLAQRLGLDHLLREAADDPQTQARRRLHRDLSTDSDKSDDSDDDTKHPQPDDKEPDDKEPADRLELEGLAESPELGVAAPISVAALPQALVAS